MRIIALYGHGRCGKSTTLNMLKELLRSAGKSVSSKPHPMCEAPEAFNYKGQIICVAPGGDDKKRILANISYFTIKQCDIAITASRCKGKGVEALVDYADSQGSNIEWKQKSYEHILSDTTKTMCNKETAQLLFDLI